MEFRYSCYLNSLFSFLTSFHLLPTCPSGSMPPKDMRGDCLWIPEDNLKGVRNVSYVHYTRGNLSITWDGIDWNLEYVEAEWGLNGSESCVWLLFLHTSTWGQLGQGRPQAWVTTSWVTMQDHAMVSFTLTVKIILPISFVFPFFYWFVIKIHLYYCS